MEGELILFPEYEELKRTLEKLRTELSMLVLERDELKYVICRNLETEYMLKLGSLEHQVFRAQCDVLRMKRKMEMIQAARNRQEKIDPARIEQQLDLEFTEYQKKLDDQITRMNDAIERSHLEVLTDEQNRELKKLYRAIVKALHPDLNPDTSAEEERLFNNAVEAYQGGDLQTLRIIHEMVAQHTAPGYSADAMRRLADEKRRLRGHLRAIRDDVAQIKSRYPYTMMDLLKDEEQLAAKKAELNILLAEYQEISEDYQERISKLLRM